ncbi:MAG: NAD(P)-dependent oxidoreductase [Alloprevotella sp.]|nr:NAD(P)-dependent oxidoreductase [Alloprevotella sp.]
MNYLAGKRILITGASGFIGSFLVERALEEGMEVWAAVRRSSSHGYLTDPRIRFVELDLDNETLLATQLQQAGPWDFCVHAAGLTKSLRAEDFFRVNTEGTRHLVRQLLSTQTLRGRFIFMSSLSVFGPVREEFRSHEGHVYSPILDTDTPRPNTVYGFSKLAAEQALAEFSALDYVILRPTGVYGPREKDYFLMAKSIAQHVDFGAGSLPQEITFIYVRDLVEATFLALTNGPSARGYFLTDGSVYDSATFGRLLQTEMGVRFVLPIKAPLGLLKAICSVSEQIAQWRNKPTTLNTDKYHILAQRNWQCDIAPARQLLGYQPHYSLVEGVKETVAWYKKNGWL